jgi:Fur family transcriptional regulator, ferric uptake regulator
MERNTAQRDAIRRAFDECDRPMGPQEALTLAQSHVPGLGIATVYRTINSLVEDGWLVPVQLPGDPPRYERSHKKHHHHFHCRGCGRVYDISGCPGNLKALTPPQFVVEDHEVVLYGKCPSCAGAQR